MNEQLDRVRRAYDLTVEQFKNSIDPLADVPDRIKDTPFFKSMAAESIFLNSAASDIKEYLNPSSGMRFLDAGCSANLANYRLHLWPSTYYGVDISHALIMAMENFVKRKQISIGGLKIADISKLPYGSNFFDISAVIGVLEYCTLEYIGVALGELNRILKPGSHTVLDIPNPSHRYVTDMQRLEEYLGRPNFVHHRPEFEVLLEPFFTINRIHDSQVMIKYFVQTKK